MAYMNNYPAWNPYANQYSQTTPVQMPQAPQQNQYYANPNNMSGSSAYPGIIWVDGEIGAKAYQLPAGCTPNSPIPLWDTNDLVIYLKSYNQYGMPNPLQKIHYTMDDIQQNNNGFLMSGSNGNNNGNNNMSGNSSPDMSQYVTKNDFDQLRQEIRNMNMQHNQNNQNQQSGMNGNNQNGSRGGNK